MCCPAPECTTHPHPRWVRAGGRWRGLHECVRNSFKFVHLGTLFPVRRNRVHGLPMAVDRRLAREAGLGEGLTGVGGRLYEKGF